MQWKRGPTQHVCPSILVRTHNMHPLTLTYEPQTYTSTWLFYPKTKSAPSSSLQPKSPHKQSETPKGPRKDSMTRAHTHIHTHTTETVWSWITWPDPQVPSCRCVSIQAPPDSYQSHQLPQCSTWHKPDQIVCSGPLSTPGDIIISDLRHWQRLPKHDWFQNRLWRRRSLKWHTASFCQCLHLLVAP